jgi:hypothetical protein
MRAYDIFSVAIIFLLILSIYMFNIFNLGIGNIQKNWIVYRCNPTIMPFAGYFGHDPVENFGYCIQNMQTSYMGFLLKPTHYLISTIQSMLGGLTTDINWIRKKIESLVSNLTNIIVNIFGIFINIIIEFQRIFIKLKDTFSKVLGIMVSVIYIIEGGMLSGKSIMAGPVGETLKFVCFHPKTKLRLENGISKTINNIDVDDILQNGSKVLATLKIKGNVDINFNNNSIYKIKNNTDNTDILVTGSHLILNKETNKFIPVNKISNKIATKCNNIKCDYFYCLITDDHKICIGEHIFWDWEDDGIYLQ